jgi:hypothetical protein
LTWSGSVNHALGVASCVACVGFADVGYIERY